LSRSNSHKEKQNATGSIQRKRSARSGSARSSLLISIENLLLNSFLNLKLLNYFSSI